MDARAQLCQWIRLGQVDYQEAWDLQGAYAEEIAAGRRPPTLLLLEHPHTYTFGRRGQVENLLWSEEELQRRQVQVFWVDRGGDVTYHGPGQLVGYPLLPLAPVGSSEMRQGQIPQLDVVGYLRRLERVLITALAELGLPGCRSLSGLTGVWVPGIEANQPPAKIAAIGVKVDARGITRHGFALNVQPDMTYWQGIIGCGLVDKPVCSLAERLPVAPGMPLVEEAIVEAFGLEFGYRMIEEMPPPDSFCV